MDAAAAAAANGAGCAEADVVASDSDVLFTITQPARGVPDERVSMLDQQVVAPPNVASAGSLARQHNSNTWHVQQHVAMEAFLYTSGPPEITRYNFGLVARVIKHELTLRTSSPCARLQRRVPCGTQWPAWRRRRLPRPRHHWQQRRQRRP